MALSGAFWCIGITFHLSFPDAQENPAVATCIVAVFPRVVALISKLA